MPGRHCHSSATPSLSFLAQGVLSPSRSGHHTQHPLSMTTVWQFILWGKRNKKDHFNPTNGTWSPHMGHKIKGTFQKSIQSCGNYLQLTTLSWALGLKFSLSLSLSLSLCLCVSVCVCVSINVSVSLCVWGGIYMYVCIPCACRCLQRPQEGIRSPGTGVVSYLILVLGTEPREMAVLLTDEPSLQLPATGFNRESC